MSHIMRLYPDSINQHTNARILDTQEFGHLIINTFVFPFLEEQKQEKTQLMWF